MKEEIINMLNQKGIKINEKNIDGKKYLYSLYNDRIYFLYFDDMSDESKTILDKIQEFSFDLNEIILQGEYNNFYADIGLSNKDVENYTADLRLFLWDIYILVINMNASEKQYVIEDKLQLERDKLIARKVVIEENEIEDITKRLFEKMNNTYRLNELLTKYEDDFTLEGIAKQIIAKNLEEHINDSKNKLTENERLVKRIKELLGMEQESNISIDDIKIYLEKIAEIEE